MGLYPSDWAKCPPHAHAYKARTDVTEGHYHLIEGISQPVNGSNTDRHTHFYRGITSFERGHFHRYYGVTGLQFQEWMEHIITRSRKSPILLISILYPSHMEASSIVQMRIVQPISIV